jgi:phage-related protein
VATVIGLGVQFSANANGMTKGLSQVDRQLQNLGKQAAAAGSLFDTFTSSSAAAGAAQQQVATDIAFLGSAFKTGQISAQEYAAELQAVVGSAQTAAAAFAEGARITEQVATAEERRTNELERLGQLLAQGAISEETYARAAAEASGANQEAAAAETDRAKALARAAQITQANLSPQQKYDAQVQELAGHLAAGRISQDTYNSALSKASQEFSKATSASDKFGASVDGAGGGGTMKFNELSGVLSALPGPIGNVAGRLSGLSSAGEGLGKVFGGGAGLSGGLANIGASVAGLVNPFTVGLAAVAAFGAGASAVASGLLDLEDRVEKLGNTADKLGVSFEFIQLLEEAGNRSGVSIESVSSAFGKLQKTLAGADEESRAATEALGRLGISFTDLENLSPEEQIRLVGEQLQGIEDPAKRTAAAMQIFGKSGADLLPFFANLGPAADDIERLGGSLTDIDRSRIDDFGAGIDALGVASSRLGELLLLPFTGLGEGISQGAAEFLGGINAIVGPIGDVLEPILSGLGAAIEIVGVILGGIGRSIGALLAPVGDLAQAWGGLADIFNEGLVDVVRSLVDAQVASYEWLASFSPLNAIAENIGAIGETMSRIANIVTTALSQIADYVGRTVGAWAEFFGIESAIESIGGLISSVFGGVASTFETISNAIGGTVGRLLSIAEKFLGITAEVDTTITPELDLSQPSLAATQFAKDIGTAATAAAEFGQAGFDAALAYQNSLEQIAQLQADGTLTAEEAKKAAEQEKAAFEAKIETLDQEAQAQARAAEAAQKAADEKIAAAERAAAAAVEADRKLADAFITAQGLGGGDQVTAADNLLAITRQIEETEAAIAAARASGDKAAEEAATRRLAVLDQAQAAAEETAQFGFSTQDAERAIASVREDLDETFSFVNFELAPEAFTAAQEQLTQLEADLEAKVIDPETFEQAADAIRSGFEDALRTAEKIRDLNEQYAQRAAEIDAERIDALSQVSQQTVQATDVRTSEGASEFLRLATGREDPAISEYRKQLSELQKIAREIGKLGGVVDIVGAA